MSLELTKSASPNCDQREIEVGYLVLHYTAVDLEDSLRIFMNPATPVSAHLLIDLDGRVHELVSCLDGVALRSWHAGVSRWNGVEGLNDHAIGIELVNYNGNIFTYTDDQYQSLAEIVEQLKQHFPALCHPDRVLGHEQVAGFRGKADPGRCFDWERFFNVCYPGQDKPIRASVCPVELQTSLESFKSIEPVAREARSKFWQSVSSLTETSVKLIQEASRK